MNVSVTHQGDRIEVSSPIALKAVVSACPTARWDRFRKRWRYAPTPATAAALAKVLEDYGASFDEETVELVEAWRTLQGDLDRYRDYESTDLEPLPFETTYEPWRHQLAAYRATLHARGALLYLGMGAGKTKTTCDLILGRGHQRTLVVCTKKIIDQVWVPQVKEHAPALSCLGLSKGSVRKRQERAEKFLSARASRQALVVINYESVWREPFASWALEYGFDLVVADEVHRIKAPGGKASRFMGKLADCVPYRLGLSGTPIATSFFDAYGQYRFLDKGVFGTSFARFRNRYAVMGGYEGREVEEWRNLDDFNRRFYSIAFRVDRDVLDLPPATHISRSFRLSGEAARIYRELRDEYIAGVEDGFITASNALVKLLKLQQTACGFAKLESGEIVPLHTEKSALLVEILEDLDPEEPVIVFARFKPDLEAIHQACHKAGRLSLELSGDVDEIAQWQEGQAPVLVVQIQSGREGIDLTRACYCVFWSLNQSPSDFDQALARPHRPGQERPVTFIHLEAEGTLEPRMREGLMEKKNFIDSVLSNPKEAL